MITRLDLDLSNSQMSDLIDAMQTTAVDAAQEGYAQVGLGNPADSLFEQLNQRALEWAQDNAADLVSGVTETTRDVVRQAIVKGLDGNLSTADIAKSIESLTAFSDDRAKLIAETEIAGANSEGALQGYIAASDAGVNLKKQWLLGADPCDVCQTNAAAGPIDLQEPFPSGDMATPGHPHCKCSIAPVVYDGVSDD